MKILIAIPVYNERQYAGPVLDQIKSYHDDVLVIDDGSTDGTGDYLANRDDIALIRHPENRGYGQSLIDAFGYADRAGYDWVITMDCDEQHEPSKIPAFIREIETDQYDLISGSRYLQTSDRDDAAPSDRRQINITLTAAINELFGWQLTDTFCGFKAHRVSAMRRLRLDVPGYAFPMQLWPQVYKAVLRIKEIAVPRIYNDPNRHFGGLLDDAAERLAHYRAVLKHQVSLISCDACDSSDESVCCSRSA